jgi:thymidylate synthase (FAD)
MMQRVSVLDSGHVDLISVMGSDLTVVNAARVSFNKESDWGGCGEDYTIRPGKEEPFDNYLNDRDVKLINYLAKHKHWTPFAHPQITLRIKAPIFIRTQLFKHKVGFVENEVSRRYVTETPTVYYPKWRTAPTNGAKQGSSDFINDVLVEAKLEMQYNSVIVGAIKTYEDLLEQGVAPEQARSVLPQGTYTEWWWTGSLAGYARVVQQRSDPHAQWEVREYANAIGNIVSPFFPVSWEALTTK